MAIPEEDRIWRKRGWIAEIIKDEDDDGWAVSMTPEGGDEPVFVAPWTMGRNKKDPKPLNEKDFATWVKAATEYLGRTQFQNRTSNRRSVDVVDADGQTLQIVYDVIRDDFEPRGVLTALDSIGDEIARVETEPAFQLTLESAEDWVHGGFEVPSVDTEAPFQEREESFVEEEIEYVDEVYEEGYVSYDEGPVIEYEG